MAMNVKEFLGKYWPLNASNYSPGIRKIGRYGLVLFLGGLFAAGMCVPDHRMLAVLSSCAFMIAGLFTGFLFALPRAGTNARINTNLEQVSDWLTKILVGLGLTQITKIPPKMRNLATYLSSGFGGDAATIFCLVLVLFFSILGFLMGFLLTRLGLQNEFDQGDPTISPTLDTATLAKVPSPAPGVLTVLKINGSDFVGGDTQVILSSSQGQVGFPVGTSDGKSGIAGVLLPSDYSSSTTAALQSKAVPSFKSSAVAVSVEQ